MAFPTMPHLPDANAFPGSDDIRVFSQYKNAFDYSRWAADTQILMCSVPWDGTSNVVAFASDDERDAWFADTDGYRDTLQTEMRILPDGMIKVPIPFDASGLYNYVWVTFPIATSATKPLDYEPQNAVRYWGFFIDDFAYRSPSCTELHLTVDWWTTFIGGVSVKSMMLARGHYALSQAASVSSYLESPITHTSWLQGVEPEGVGEPITNVKASFVLNDDFPYLVFDVQTADPSGSFSNGVPYVNYHYRGACGMPTGNMLAVPIASADTFATGAPQGLWQCIRAAYVVPGKFLTLGTGYALAGVTVYPVMGGASITQDVHLTKSDFSYPSDYVELTKLYTSPYATVHLVSDTGQDIVIAPETLGATQRMDVASQVTAAGVRILSVLQGVGSSDVSSLTLRNYTEHSFAQSGAWQKTLIQWDVPCFAVYQSSDELSDYRNQFSRMQARADANTAYQNATASNATAQTNANASATCAQNNSDANATLTTTTASNSASNVTSNNAASVAASTANTNANIAQSTSGASASNTKLVADVTSDLNASYAALQADQAVVSVTMSNNDARSQAASVSQDMSLVNGIANVAGAALSGDIGGAISGAVSTITGQVSTSTNIATDWQTANASALVTASNNTTLYNAGVQNATEKGAHARTYTTNATSISNTAKSTINANNNSAANTIASNNASLLNANARSQAATTRANASRTYDMTTGNASRTKSTADANATRTRDNALSAVTNGIYTDNVQAPMSFGAIANMDARQIVPMCVQVKVERPCDDDIARCGDSMLRYGYCCNRNISTFPGWQVMRHFTYWQAHETWITANGKVPESAVRYVRGLLESGITVWSKPDEIGAVSIYDN